MKAFRSKEDFKPITIVLETLEEADLLLLLFAHTNDLEVKKKLQDNFGGSNVREEQYRFSDEEVDVLQDMYCVLTEIHRYDERRT